jgi:NADH-quinone oxidoreductase subunit J
MVVAGGCFVITAKNPVRAVLSLVFTFFCMAGNWMLLESEFLSITLVLVYVGAVMVLFLFVVMMIHLESPIQQTFVKHWPVKLMFSLLFFIVLLMAVSPQYFDPPVESFKSYPADFSHIRALGTLLYTDYLLPFEMAGVILLVAMIGAIGLTYRGPRDCKPQNPGQQVQVRKADRLKIIKMSAEEGS